jgi:hypothetical protein
MLNTPAINLTHVIRQGTVPKSFQNLSLSCGMPLPDASGQKEFNRNPTANEVTTIIANVPARNTPLGAIASRP